MIVFNFNEAIYNEFKEVRGHVIPLLSMPLLWESPLVTVVIHSDEAVNKKNILNQLYIVYDNMYI